MGWVKASVKAEAGQENANSNAYGTRTPIVSDQYTGAFNALKGNLGANGLNSLQQTAVDHANGRLQSGGMSARIAGLNGQIGATSTAVGALANKGPYLLNGSPTVSAQNIGTSKVTTQDVETQDVEAERIAAKSGADFMDRYKNPYERDVVNAALADYDAGVDTNRAGMRAANSGAFANKRYGVAEGQFAGEAARGRGSLSGNLLSQGFNTRAGLGMADADRNLSADTTNAANLLSASTSNAANKLSASTSNAANFLSASTSNAANDLSASTSNASNKLTADKYNADMSDSRERFNVDSNYKSDEAARSALMDKAKLDQSQIDNIITADGVDTEYAKALFSAGEISQEQLSVIVDAASEYNGSEFDETRSSKKTNLNVSTEASFTGI
jgi:hypothetical protein